MSYASKLTRNTYFRKLCILLWSNRGLVVSLNNDLVWILFFSLTVLSGSALLVLLCLEEWHGQKDEEKFELDAIVNRFADAY
jgi:hypothetical protein